MASALDAAQLSQVRVPLRLICEATIEAACRSRTKRAPGGGERCSLTGKQANMPARKIVRPSCSEKFLECLASTGVIAAECQAQSCWRKTLELYRKRTGRKLWPERQEARRRALAIQPFEGSRHARRCMGIQSGFKQRALDETALSSISLLGKWQLGIGPAAGRAWQHDGRTRQGRGQSQLVTHVPCACLSTATVRVGPDVFMLPVVVGSVRRAVWV